MSMAHFRSASLPILQLGFDILPLQFAVKISVGLHLFVVIDFCMIIEAGVAITV